MLFLIVFFSFLCLIVLHELGHYLFAKKFGVKVEEFGIGLPPRVWGRKIGETVYSLNLLPLGAFVRLEGEEHAVPGPRSFSGKPMWQRAVIVAAGVVAFWAVAAVIFTLLGMTSGIPTGISDQETEGVTNPQVRILGVSKDSPAKEAGIALGDVVLALAHGKTALSPTTIREIQQFTSDYPDKEISVTLLRGNETVETSLTARANPPEGQGPLGVALVRTAFVHYPWYMAPAKAIQKTFELSSEIVRSLGGLAASLFAGKGVPEGVEIAGPVGILHLLTSSLSLGVPHFLSFFAVLALYLAIFNALPLPVVDGGKLLFLGIEAVRRKPLPAVFEKNLSAVFFVLLISLMIWVTIKDISKLI